jgi:FkbM family methyltransferase
MTDEGPTRIADPARGSGHLHKLVKPGWTVVVAGVGDGAWLRTCVGDCPDAHYHVFAAAGEAVDAAPAGLVQATALGAAVDPSRPATTLDRARQAAGIRHVHYLRIEHPTAALDVVLGARQTLLHSRIDVIDIAPLDGPGDLAPLALLLARYDYRVMRLVDGAFSPITNADLAASAWPGRTVAIHARLLVQFTETTQEILDLGEILPRYGIAMRGVLHLGAHEAEDLPTYLAGGAARVVLVEAHPDLAARLRARLADEARVIVVHAAINDADGPVGLHVTSRDASSSLLELEKHAQIYPHIVETDTIEVPGTTVDHLLDRLGLAARDFNVMTVDVQGAELRALRGAARTLPALDAIRVEINFEELYRGCAQVEDIDDFLGAAGFSRVVTLTPFHMSWGDALYVRNDRASQG